MNGTELDRRITDALRARAEQVTERDLRPATAPTSLPRPSRWRWLAPMLAAAAVALVAVATTVAVDRAHSGEVSPAGTTSGPPSGSLNPSPSDSSTGPAPSPSRGGVLPSRSAPRPGSSPVTPGTIQPIPGHPTIGLPAPYEPLWPFSNAAEVVKWQEAHTKNGSQPWHVDPGETALSFTRGYLGFADITRVVSVQYEGTQQAHVAVGYLDLNGGSHTAAVLHLVRFSSAADGPWEVVGSDDTTFSLEQPAYGTQISSPVVAGGHITGVDESIRVWIAQSDSGIGAVLDTIPAGGQNTPWSSHPLAFAAQGTVTIVAATGGHLQSVERFAIQGVHT